MCPGFSNQKATLVLQRQKKTVVEGVN